LTPIIVVTPPTCPRLNVEILVDDQPLKEYNDIDEKLNTVTKNIEAKTDANFALSVKINRDFLFPAGDIEIETSVNGDMQSSAHLAAEKMFCPLGTVVHGRKVELSHGMNTLQRFRFSALQIGRSSRRGNLVALHNVHH
jgi:hypothetical protein